MKFLFLGMLIVAISHGSSYQCYHQQISHSNIVDF